MNRYEFYSNLQTYKKQHEEDSLSHYGILGQKWGTRRWQNQDGTFNAEGKERYFGTKKSESKLSSKAADIYKNYKPNEWNIGLNRSNLSTKEWYKLKTEMNNKLYSEDKKFSKIINDKDVQSAMQDYINARNEINEEEKRVFSEEFRNSNPKARDFDGDGWEYWHEFADPNIIRKDDETYKNLKEAISKKSTKNMGFTPDLDTMNKVVSDIKEACEREKDSDKIYDLVKENMGIDIRNPDQKIGGFTNGKVKTKEEVNNIINKRNNEMNNDENEDMLIGSNPDKKAYKAKVKELKKQAKEMGVPFGERGHLAKYCAQNGIDEITDKIVEGHKAGDDLWNDSIRMNNATDQIDHFVQHTKRGEHVRSDKNVKEFTKNNKNFKDFQKNVEKMNKTLKKANDELISKLKKAGLDLDPILVDSNNEGKTVRLDYYKEGSKEYQILNKAFQEVYKGSMQTEFKKYAKEARESLGHFEKDCHNFAKEYLVDQAEYNDPYRYAFTYEKDTGKTRSTKMYETYGYLMTEPYWNEVGGP